MPLVMCVLASGGGIVVEVVVVVAHSASPIVSMQD